MAPADGKDAASGAIGGVVGEIAAQELSRVLTEKLDSGTITAKEVGAWMDRGVDVSKLAAGLVAAAVGADVNTAAHTGGNSAENNALPLIILGGMIALELIDKGIQTYNAWQFAKAVQAGDSAKATEYGTELALSLGTDAITGNAAFIKMLNSFGLVALSTKIGQKVEKVASTVLPKNVIKLTEANITGSGKTVLGSFPGYIEQAKATGSSYFDIGTTWSSLTKEQRWAANVHFLDTIAARGDVVNISISKSAIRPDSILADEIRHLVNHRGYQWTGPKTLRRVK